MRCLIVVALLCVLAACANPPATPSIARLSDQQSLALAQQFAVGPEQQNRIHALTSQVQREQDKADAVRAQWALAQTYGPYSDYGYGYGYGCGFSGCLGAPYPLWPSVGVSFGYYRGWYR